MEHSLSNKVALVTGGGHGIGAAIARQLATMGGTTVISCKSLVCDVSDWNSVAALAQRVQQTFNRLDILVNNAGIGGFGGPLHSMPLENWDAVLNTNLRGIFYTVRAFAPLMIAGGGGDIINISSIAGKNPLPNGAAYAASKWGLNGLSYSIAEELRGHK